MSQTLGQFLLNEVIPSNYRPEGAFTKKKLQTAMTRLAKDDPHQYVKTITDVKRLGDEFATREGISVGLDDVAPLYKERNAIVKPALEAVKNAKSRDDRIKIISQTQDKLLQYAMTHPGTMGDMARAGARGNALQLMRAVGAPAAASDEKDNIQPWLTVRSYSEGLRPSEWWAANREARMAAVKSNIEVQDPGELSKILINNTSDQVITTSDCGTHNGLKFSVDNSAILDRYLAKPAGTLGYNTLITPRVISVLKKANIHDIVVRSPMTCEADAGICQHCMGLNTVGKLNRIGENVGVRASQSLGEPLTQMALNAKHGVRLSGQNPMDIGGLEGFRAIIESPASFKNKATLSPIDGIVESVTKAPQGGYYVKVGAEKVYITQGLEPLVKVGDHVHAGDALSQGVPRPDEVVKYKGLGAGREYLIDKLSQIYKNAGIDTDRRHFEVLAKATLNYLHIDDVDDKDSADHGLIRGDVIEYNKFRNIVAGQSEEVSIDNAEGRYLGEAVFYHLAGTRLTPALIKELKRAGVTRVKVAVRAPSVSPIMAPATRNPLLNPDWIVRMGHRYLKQTLLEGAHEGHKSNLHGAHPVPGLVFSSEFGEGSSGRY
jgi:DNA-directed RNA polymerase subunit beta'